MARQKKVFTNNEITTKYLEQSQDYGRTSNSSMFFEKNKMFSYGSHFIMALVSGNDLLISKRDSTVTTNKHLASLALDAKRGGFNVVEVFDVEASTDDEHAINIADLQAQVDHANSKAMRARAEWRIKYWQNVAAEKLSDIAQYQEVVKARINN